ncbi:MAG TPA: sugar phosphate isomerase/epimerase family protein [Flavisolibacter sp.]|jgi:sugar phosphate isomerase/epimerase|nr:sugar phosphate isomerase/epimerase family protein [Flavisolibacter sp.]
MNRTTRRKFVSQLAGMAALGITGTALAADKRNGFSATSYEFSLAEWSLHKALFGKQMTNLDFPEVARRKFDIGVVEYVNQFFMDKAEDTSYLNQLLQRCKDNQVRNHLIMCDNEGNLGDTDASVRKKAVENHYKWVHAAKYLGCATIRVNAFGKGSAAEVQKAAIDGLAKLGSYAAKEKINVIVENHGGHTSNGKWLAGVMKGVNMTNVGTLPDFNNFCIRREGDQPWSGKCIEEYDRYTGVKEMMPFAKGVSAKTIDFDAAGNCVETDYIKMMKIIKDSGFKGFIGIEYEGEQIGEEDGIRKTKDLLQRMLA